jgi:hypothetical protein
MTRPPFAVMHRHYPDKRSVLAAELYLWIGHPAYADHPAWNNTCAIRMSLALNGAGIVTPCPRLVVRSGTYKGRQLQPSQRELSKYLAQRSIWGAPEVYNSGEEARKGIGSGHGVISFFSLYGGTNGQGHIDLVGPGDWGPACEEDCYWMSTTIWFWRLR